MLAPSEGSGCPDSGTAATPDPSHITSPPARSVSTLAAVRELASLSLADLCVTCQLQVGRVRATVLRAVVCGPCWAAHGGFPDAGEIGPTPTVTVASADPRDQWHWLSALRRQTWVDQIRADGRANLLAVARLVALHAGWDTLESRPTWARLVARSGLSERTVARWLQELRVRGWLAHLEHGSTPAHRPMVLAQLAGNRAAVYGLRIPLTPEEALHRAFEQLLARLVTELTDRATDVATPADPQRHPAAASPAPPCGRDRADDQTEDESATTGPVPAGSGSVPTAGSPKPNRSEQDHPRSPGDRNGSPTGSCLVFKKGEVGGFSRASESVDNSAPSPAKSGGSNPTHHQRTALRAGSDQETGPDWAVTVPTSKFAALIAADWLRARQPVMTACSRKLIRHLCKPYWRAGWTGRDILHAMGHRPGVFGQQTGVLICPERIAAPKAFIASRLAAWHTPKGAILPGHSRVTDSATTQTARRLVAARNGRAGAALLQPGERALTAHRITEHGRTVRPPVSLATRVAAKASLAAVLADNASQRRTRPARIRPSRSTSGRCSETGSCTTP